MYLEIDPPHPTPSHPTGNTSPRPAKSRLDRPQAAPPLHAQQRHHRLTALTPTAPHLTSPPPSPSPRQASFFTFDAVAEPQPKSFVDQLYAMARTESDVELRQNLQKEQDAKSRSGGSKTKKREAASKERQLTRAVVRDDIDTVMKLLEEGADINYTNAAGLSLLDLATEVSHTV